MTIRTLVVVGVVVLCLVDSLALTARGSRMIWVAIRSRTIAIPPMQDVAFLRGGREAAVLTSTAFLYVTGSIAAVPYDAPPPGIAPPVPAAAVVQDRQGHYLLRVVREAPARPQPAGCRGVDGAGSASGTAVQRHRRSGPRDLGRHRSPGAPASTRGAFPSEAYKWFTVTLFVLALAAIPYYFVLACIRMSIAPLDSDNPRGFALCVFVIASIAAVVGLLYGRRLSVRGDAVVRRIGRQLPPHLAQTAWPTVAAATVGLIVATYGGAAIWPGDPRFAQAASIELTTGIPLKSSNKAAGCSGSSCSGGDSGGAGAAAEAVAAPADGRSADALGQFDDDPGRASEVAQATSCPRSSPARRRVRRRAASDGR